MKVSNFYTARLLRFLSMIRNGTRFPTIQLSIQGHPKLKKCAAGGPGLSVL